MTTVRAAGTIRYRSQSGGWSRRGRRITTLEMVDALSRVLEIPSPVCIAESRQEAVAFQRERPVHEVCEYMLTPHTA